MRNSDRFRHRLLSVVVMFSALLAEAAWAMTFNYDSFGRVIKVTYDNGSYVEYEYDVAGNRKVVKATKL